MAMACLLLAMALHGAAGFALPAGSLRTLSAAPRSPHPSAQMPSTAAGIKPMQDYVLVDLQSVPSATSSGVLLPTVYFDGTEKNDEAFIAPEPRAGTVVAVGPGRRSWDGNVLIPMPPLRVRYNNCSTPCLECCTCACYCSGDFLSVQQVRRDRDFDAADRARRHVAKEIKDLRPHDP